jgi:hypothetical protein
MASTRLEHFLFREYSRAVKNWLIDTLYLSNYSRENNVTIVYMTPDRAWSEYVYPVVNGGTLSPNVNFFLEEMEYKENENLLGFVKEHKKINGEYRELKPPLIYRLTYSATIYTRTQAELDIIFYQLLSNSHQNAKAHFAIDGQWAELQSISPRTETNLEPSETQDVVRRGGISFVIDRAYLPMDYSYYNGIIDSYDFDYDVDNYINGE